MPNPNPYIGNIENHSTRNGNIHNKIATQARTHWSVVVKVPIQSGLRFSNALRFRNAKFSKNMHR